MILGCLIVGMICGAVAAISALLSGVGLWLTLLAYSGAGTLGLCLAMGFTLAHQKSDEEEAVAEPA